MRMNWKVRIKNPVWWAQIALAVLLPILAYFGMTLESLTSWAVFGQVLIDAISNPYVLILVVASVWNACNDPTTKGLADGVLGRSYERPQ